MHARSFLVLVALLALALASYTGCATSDGDGDSDSSAHGDGGLDWGDASACTTSNDCDGGTCIEGHCCAAAQACGSTCCGGGNVCLFDQCVMPGNTCRSQTDCAPNEYCEPALGAGDAGASLGCDPLPSPGRCLPRPPTCAGDAGTSADGGSCLEACEVHADAGILKPLEKWSWGASETVAPDFVDVWSTPTVGRMVDANCDGKIDALDSPVVVFVSGSAWGIYSNGDPNWERDGVLRMVDGRTGKTIWSLEKASSTSIGFMGGLSVAIGDVDGDGFMDVVAMTGEGSLVVVDRNGKVTHTSDLPYAITAGQTGWGGALAIGDMDQDGFPEIAYADTVWTMKSGKLSRVFAGGKGIGGVNNGSAISVLADLDGNGSLELVAGNTAYKANGQVLWQNTSVPDGTIGVADFDKDGKPEVVLVRNGLLWILNGATGAIVTGPLTLPGTGQGGPPTIASFDGAGLGIGVAKASDYSVVKPTITNGTITGLTTLWYAANQDPSSSETGSTVFDFEGDGRAEVIYADECWLWVFDGKTGSVRLAYPHTSFTATEASIVADIDGDGHAEMLLPSQGIPIGEVDGGGGAWNCAAYQQGGLAKNGQHWTKGNGTLGSYRGLVALADRSHSWVGTRTLWNEHGYHVSNICDDTDNACPAPNVYGSIPKTETPNWKISWLDDFRQNIGQKGIFDAADAVVSMTVDCRNPLVAHVSIRNVGQATLPAGVTANVLVTPGDTQVGQVTTTMALFPGQTQTIDVALSAPATQTSALQAAIYVDPQNPSFQECRAENDRSPTVTPACGNVH